MVEKYISQCLFTFQQKVARAKLFILFSIINRKAFIGYNTNQTRPTIAVITLLAIFTVIVATAPSVSLKRSHSFEKNLHRLVSRRRCEFSDHRTPT